MAPTSHKAKHKIWITRSQPSAEASAAAVEAAKFEGFEFEAITAPLLTVIPIEAPIEASAAPAENTALIFTSQNGIRAFCAAHTAREFPVITVGDASAALAENMGFKDVSSANGSAADIAPLIAQINEQHIKRGEKPHAHYMHISGQHVRGNVSEDIKALGLRCERQIYYRSAPVEALPDIDLGTLHAALLMSPLAAKTLAAFKPDTRGLTFVSISPATDAALGDLPCKARITAARPTLQSMIAALARTV